MHLICEAKKNTLQKHKTMPKDVLVFPFVLLHFGWKITNQKVENFFIITSIVTFLSS
jgi:hypothetical protein